jgi:hypothetical protein
MDEQKKQDLQVSKKGIESCEGGQDKIRMGSKGKG